MTSQLAASVDFTLPFYRSRVVVAMTTRHHRRHSGWFSGLGRALTTTVWLAGAGVVVVVGLIIGVISCCSRVLDDVEQNSSVGDGSASAAGAATTTSRRRRLKNTCVPRESLTVVYCTMKHNRMQRLHKQH